MSDLDAEKCSLQGASGAERIKAEKKPAFTPAFLLLQLSAE
jgi:hypothetical protein